MDSNEDSYQRLMSLQSCEHLAADKAIEHLASLNDVCMDLRRADGLLHSIKLSEELQSRTLLPGQSFYLHYCTGTAWQNLREIREGQSCNKWDWEQKETEMALLNFRKALAIEGTCELPDELVCRTLTNLANLLDRIGRFVQAIDYWDRALAKLPQFPMARGNKGMCLTKYANSLYDQGQRGLVLERAHAELEAAVSSEVRADAADVFRQYSRWIESVLKPEYLKSKKDLDAYSTGDSEQESAYRRWCLANRLFLNPLNDLGTYAIAACDVLTTPSIVVDLSEGPYYPGYFNQMKQEYVSARFLYYEGLKASTIHFSDRNVLLYNTLDYPCYCLSVEKMKAAFRMAYSLFDKIAFFLNRYFSLSMPERHVSFRGVWYKSGERKKGLRSEFKQCENLPLRGLFWISKDLFEDRPGFTESIEPDAQELGAIRNHLEHRYLKLHEPEWAGPPGPDDQLSQAMADTMAFSMYRCDFEARILRLLKTARAALIYLALAIHCQEQGRTGNREADQLVGAMPLDVWEDEWKF